MQNTTDKTIDLEGTLLALGRELGQATNDLALAEDELAHLPGDAAASAAVDAARKRCAQARAVWNALKTQHAEVYAAFTASRARRRPALAQHAAGREPSNITLPRLAA
jgi:hypothetical protein